MKQPIRRIGIFGFEGANALDMVGPLEAFASAGRADYTHKESRGAYEIVMMGLQDKAFSAESGVRFVPHCRLEAAPDLDTLIVPGGWGLREPASNAAIGVWLRKFAPRIRRVASVCTGIYGLAPVGLLDGRRATTHWRFVADVAQRFPRVHVQGDALFKRSGGQEQFSEPLRFQTQSLDSFSDLIAWICTHLDRDLSTDVLAARVRLSVRHFSRRFTAAVGRSPTEFVESARLSEARDRLRERFSPHGATLRLQRENS